MKIITIKWSEGIFICPLPFRSIWFWVGLNLLFNKRCRIPKGQSKKDNPEKLATQSTQDEEKQSKNTTQYVLDNITQYCVRVFFNHWLPFCPFFFSPCYCLRFFWCTHLVSSNLTFLFNWNLNPSDKIWINVLKFHFLHCSFSPI